jgi:hypothetical protein
MYRSIRAWVDEGSAKVPLACKHSELEAWLARAGTMTNSNAPLLEQSSTVRTYTRDAYSPVRRDAHSEVEKINGWHTSALKNVDPKTLAKEYRQWTGSILVENNV